MITAQRLEAPPLRERGEVRNPSRGAPRPFRTAACLAAAVTAGLAVWLLAGVGGANLTNAVDDIVETLAALCAAVMCWKAYRRLGGPGRDRGRRAWALLGAASLSWGVAQALWTLYEVILHTSPFPSLADPFYLAFVPLAAAGLLAFAQAPTGSWSRLQLVLDGLIAATSALFVSWAVLLGPAARNASGTLLARSLSVAYPAGDLLLFVIVLVVATRAWRTRSFALLAAGIVALVAADSAFGYLNLAGTYNGGVLDAAWVAGFFLLGLAALVPPEPGTPLVRPRRQRLISTLLPCLPVPAVLLVVGFRIAAGSSIPAFLDWLGVATAVLILASQLVALLDLTRHLEAKVAERTAELSASEERFRSLLQNSSDTVVVLSAGLTVLYATDSAKRVLGRPPVVLAGMDFGELLDRGEWAVVRGQLLALASFPGEAVTLEHRLLRGDGYWICCETVVMNLLEDPNVGGLVLTLRNISDRRTLEQQLRHLALHDPLTGLPNRALFRDRVEHALKVAQRTRSTCGVLFIDLDNFKNVNDSLGHGAGDKLLQIIAKRLALNLRSGDSVARLGGDEFAILAENVDATEEVGLIGERLLQVLCAPVQVEGRELIPQASIGIGIVERGDSSVNDLLRNADVAMYQAKAMGKGCWRVFEPAMHTAAIHRLELEAELRQAIANHEFVAQYQPIRSLVDGTMTSVESLIRWQHPTRGLVSPAEFIPIAEETGLILPIGNWMLHEACRQVALLPQEGPGANLRVTVNLSSRQLSDPFLEAAVAHALEESGLDPARLVLEITESVLMHDTRDTIERMHRLRAKGIQFAMDDFGTGYSSLSYLRRYPIQILKIDQSFVACLGDGAGIGGEAENSAVVRAIISLAATMGMAVVAEGVETQLQADELVRLGCSWGQGYHLGRPTDISGLAQLLTSADTALQVPAHAYAGDRSA